jgi:hypothetical protein
MMKPSEQFQAALRSSEPAQALRAVVKRLVAEGRTKGEIYALLEQFVLDLRRQPDHREADEDVVLDLMDTLGDWCHPSARL